jgi:hypothetical protein
LLIAVARQINLRDGRLLASPAQYGLERVWVLRIEAFGLPQIHKLAQIDLSHRPTVSISTPQAAKSGWATV